MAAGITLLIILAVPTLFQVVMGGMERRKQHREILARLERLESKISGK